MAGFMNKPKKFPKFGTLTITDKAYKALTPSAFKVLKEIRLSPTGSDIAFDLAHRLETSPNSVRRRITELRDAGYNVITLPDSIFQNENRYYVRDAR